MSDSTILTNIKISQEYHRLTTYLVYLRKLRNKSLTMYIGVSCYLRYLGKSYRLKINKKNLTCKLNKNHWTKIYFLTKPFIKFKRNKYLCVFDFYNNFSLFKQILKHYRPTNTFTKRGLRVGKYKYIKKYAKVSQAFTKLH